MEREGRLTELDSLRGIAAALVVVFHASENLLDPDNILARVIRGTPLRPLLDGRQPVIFFFVLSGLALTHALTNGQTPGGWAFVMRRLVRLCLPASAIVLLSAGLYEVFAAPGLWLSPDSWLALSGWTRAPTVGDILRQGLLFGLDGDFYLNAVLWSLVHELRLSMVLPLVVAAVSWRGAGRRENRAAMLLTIGAVLLAGVVLGDRMIHPASFDGGMLLSLAYGVFPIAIFCGVARWTFMVSAPGTWSYRAWFVSLPCFMAGIGLGVAIGRDGQLMLGGNMPQTALASLYFAPCFFLGAAVSLGALDKFTPDRDGRGLLAIGAALLLCLDSLFASAMASIILIVLARRSGAMRDVLRWRGLAFLGRISFSLYLVHVPLLLALRHGSRDTMSEGLVLFVWLLLCGPVAWVFYGLVEVPAQRLSRRVGRPITPREEAFAAISA